MFTYLRHIFALMTIQIEIGLWCACKRTDCLLTLISLTYTEAITGGLMALRNIILGEDMNLGLGMVRLRIQNQHFSQI